MILSVLILLATAGAGQSAPSNGSDAQRLSRGWGAIADGRPSEAVALADEILKRRPRSHGALLLKIDALVADGRPFVALDTYERWLPDAGSLHEDRGLLTPIGAGVLRRFGSDADRRVRSTALKALAESGDEPALEALRRETAGGDPAAMTALASLGDPAGVSALQQFVVSEGARDNSAGLAALASRGGLSPAAVDAMLKHPSPMSRAAAASALTMGPTADGLQRLRGLQADPDPFVRMSAMLALARLGEKDAVAEARALLSSDVPDVRLRAAESLQASMPREVAQAVTPLLQNPDGLNRFRAASIVARSDPDAARAVFIDGVQDRNPAVQQEAARLFTDAFPNELSVLRQLLRAGDPLTVVSAAAAIVKEPGLARP